MSSSESKLQSDVSEPKPTRATRSRAEEREQVEAPAKRRRRDPNDTSVAMRLSVPEAALDRSKYAYRWVNDDPMRINMLYNQDWDLVSDEEIAGASQGEKAARIVDVTQNGAGKVARLMRKPVEYYQEDQAAKHKRLEDEMKAAELGRKVLNGPDGSGQGLSAEDSAHVYSPGKNVL